ncbi:MAG: hypothetical protein A2921_04785 [Candidatus Magasanikbacteria bacterium RIFCSPLOWO2_01_FULL_43_20b]|nr:MAG: hypothetical protein A2921_04785 [Candidatus Magasanikbacteria bacterium RIFCSPLOWO2_01_FULL_43_20b]
MNVYKTRVKPFAGTSYHEIKKKAFGLFNEIKKKTKRKPYIRSAYFDKQKVFFELFWEHLFKKNFWNQMRRMKFFACGVELIEKSRFEPVSKNNPNKPNEVLHRFAGISADGQKFFVQIKGDRKKKSTKWLISIFPEEK